MIIKNLSKELQKDGVQIKKMKHAKFISELKTLRGNLSKDEVEEYNGFYIFEKDLVLINQDSKHDLDYLLCHELVHSIRTNENRLGYRLTLPPVHNTMKKVLRKSYGSAYLPIYIRQATQDIAYWREEAICDSIALFLCVEYQNKEREKMDIGRFTFIPLAYEDIYTKKDKKDFLEIVEDECFEVIEYT